MRVLFKAYSFELFALTMSHRLQLIFLFFLLVALFSAAYGLPAPWGPNTNSKSHGGPSWNGGGEDSTDNIILGTGHKGGSRWNY